MPREEKKMCDICRETFDKVVEFVRERSKVDAAAHESKHYESDIAVILGATIYRLFKERGLPEQVAATWFVELGKRLISGGPIMTADVLEFYGVETPEDLLGVIHQDIAQEEARKVERVEVPSNLRPFLVPGPKEPQ